MAKSGEFYTFDEVVRQLKIDENKLKRLVSEGEISAFREGDVMKFKRSEIDKLAAKGTGSETSETVLSEITLEDEAPAFEESGETLTDDLVFEGPETGADKVDISDDAGMKTEEISSQDTFIEETDEGDVGMTTEPIDLSADLTQEVDEEEIEEVDEPAVPQRRRTPAVRRAAARETAVGNPGITFALVLASIIGLLAFALAWRTSENETGPIRFESERLKDDGLFQSMSGFFYESFGAKKTVEGTIQQIKSPTEEGAGG